MTFNFNYQPLAGWIKNTSKSILIVEKDHTEKGAVNKTTFSNLLSNQAKTCPLKSRKNKWTKIGYFERYGPDLILLHVGSTDFKGDYLLLNSSLKRLQAGQIRQSPIRKIPGELNLGGG